ncbi:MAG: phosphoribosylformylglycinamidine synthase, partial [Deltaproteobacteria bacterium]|nr:phosphoribosylformylglycinamidine synthase [Deltaproteobacteria bacterium]
YHPVTNPDGRYKAAQLVRACWGLKDACLALEVPLLSGKDSMYVDGTLTGRYGIAQRVSGPPTMMFTATAPVPDLGAIQTLEPKMAGDKVYVLGLTKDELGAGALYGLWGHTGIKVPETDLAASKRLCRAVYAGLKDGLVASACVPSRGGLALALARMVLAGRLGLNVELDGAPTLEELDAMRLLFSESTGRMVVTVSPKWCDEFERLLEDVPWAQIGQVTRKQELEVSLAGEPVLSLKGAQMRRTWRRRFGRMV